MSDGDRIPYHRIAQRFFNRPLMLTPSVADTISAVLLSHMAGRSSMASDDAASSTEVFAPTASPSGREYHSPRASRFVGATPLDDQGRPLPYRRTADGVAILTVIGELVNRGAWVGSSSGLVSYEGFTYQLQRAVADPAVRSILLDLETPGGEARGAFEAAAAVRQARESKPVVAMVNGLAASAGYAIASAASRIVSTPSGETGSIGVVMVHMDFSEYLKTEGIKPTMIFSGAHKVDGNPFEPLPEAVRERFQQESARLYDDFVSAVSLGRPQLTAAKIRETEALTYMGTDALALGLIDSVGTFDELLTEISGGSSGRDSLSTKGLKMDKPNGQAAASADQDTTNTTADNLRSAFPTQCGEIATAAATAERDRICGILALPHKGHDKLIAGLVADGRSSKADAALAMVEAERATRERQLEAIAGVESDAGAIAAAPNASGAGEPQAEANTPDAWRAEFAKSADLKTEFGTADIYVAFKQAEAEGRVRRLRKS